MGKLRDAGVSAGRDIAGGGVRDICAFVGTPGAGRLLFDLGMM